jgi:hypothetical protein
VVGFLQTWASMGEGSKDRSVTEGGQTGVVSFVGGRNLMKLRINGATIYRGN